MEDLRGIIAKANELADQLLIKLSKIEGEKAEIAKQKVAISEEKARLEKLSAELLFRAGKVKGIEDAVALKEDAGKLLEGVQGERVALGLEKEDFNKRVAEEGKRLQDIEDGLKVAQKKLEADRAALNKERETYKKQVIEEVNKNLKAR